MRQRIVDVARRSFAHQGWAGTSMRAVARDAGTNARMVGYYFADKATLLEACLEPPAGWLDGVAQTVRGPMSKRGAELVRFQLRTWSDPQSAEILRSIVLIAAHHPLAQQRVQAIFRTSLIGVVSASLDDPERQTRAGLIATQMIGLGIAREVWKLEPIASLSDDNIVALIGPTLQRYLTGRLPNLTET